MKHLAFSYRQPLMRLECAVLLFLQILFYDILRERWAQVAATEDVVSLDETASCPCGRNGQRVDIIGRLTGAELGCCAISLDRVMHSSERAVPV